MPKKMFIARHLSISIARLPSEVYGFVANPESLPQWASGLSRATMIRRGDEWIADSPMGTVSVRFAAENDFGVVDHDVTMPSGETVHNPFRVARNGEGSEVIFTLYRLPEMKDAEFDEDAAMIEADLRRLKEILEA